MLMELPLSQQNVNKQTSKQKIPKSFIWLVYQLNVQLMFGVSAECPVNVSRTDWLLKFLYRTASVQFSIAGLEPVKWDSRRMHNIDLTEAVSTRM